MEKRWHGSRDRPGERIFIRRESGSLRTAYLEPQEKLRGKSYSVINGLESERLNRRKRGKSVVLLPPTRAGREAGGVTAQPREQFEVRDRYMPGTNWLVASVALSF